jgi:glycosyltransferase involved in cell wall biosynthesis
VLENCLPDIYYEQPTHEDSEMIAWPASLHSHPNDPEVVGPAIARLVNSGVDVQIFGDTLGTGRAFGLADDLPGTGPIDFDDWPATIRRIGIGIAPLADTVFNSSKSWLKPLELAAVGVPWVGSPRTEYQRLHDQGTGILVDRSKDWYRTLRKLTNEPAWRDDLSAAGREVAEQWRLRDHAWRWWEAWSDALEIERGSRKTTHHAQTPDHAPV